MRCNEEKEMGKESSLESLKDVRGGNYCLLAKVVQDNRKKSKRQVPV